MVPVLPITPQTPVLEKLTEFQAAGEFDAEVLTPESEHSVMSACIPASLAGVRVFTATASQGLLLMHELLHYAPAARAPIVMANINRTVASPWAFWPDQTDSLAQRDTGWIQYYVESRRSARHRAGGLPRGRGIAAGAGEPRCVLRLAFARAGGAVPAQATVDAYLPDYAPPHRLDPAQPESWGNVITRDMFFRHRQDIEEAMQGVPELAAQADRAWAGRAAAATACWNATAATTRAWCW